MGQNHIEKKSLRSRQEIIKILLIPSLFVLIVIIATLVTEGQFFGLDNILNVAERASIVGIIAIGQTLVMLTGGIDLSVAAIMCMGYTAQALLASSGMGQLLSLVIALLACLIFGAVNGILVSKTNVPPFMITLSMMMIIKALALFLSRSMSLNYEGLKTFINSTLGLSAFGPRFLPTFIWLLLTAVVYIVFIKTKMGIIITAVGSNQKASFYSGIKADKTIIIVYALCGLLTGIAALILGYRMTVLNPQSSDSFLLESVAAVVIGGTSVSGGEGSILNTLFGAVIIAMLVNLMNLLMVDTYLQFAIKGMILILIVVAVQYLSGRKTA
jgi:ribose transport system permease protein